MLGLGPATTGIHPREERSMTVITKLVYLDRILDDTIKAKRQTYFILGSVMYHVKIKLGV
jgi:ribosome biogenesis GTPase A